MAKSKIIRDLIDRKINTDQALERLIVIAMEINDNDTLEWASCEKNGYSMSDSVPSYRNILLTPMGTYQINSINCIQTFKNRVLPTIGVPNDLKNSYQKHCFRQGISQIIDQYESIKKKNGGLGIPIPPELFYYFEEGTNIHLTSAYLSYSQFDLCKIIDAVRTRIIRMLVLLEKNFGDLDELDIEICDYKENEIKKLQEAFSMVINGNNNGDTYIITNSKIKKTNIGKNNSSDKENCVNVNTDFSTSANTKESIFKHILKKIGGFFGGKSK